MFVPGHNLFYRLLLVGIDAAAKLTMKHRYHLSDTDRHILYLVSIDASASVAKIAAALGCKTHVVRAAYTKFRRDGLLTRRVMIDTFLLGYSRHSLCIALSPEMKHLREEMAKFLAKQPNTAVVLEVGGDYDLFITILARSPEELSHFQSKLSARFSNPIQHKDITISLQHSTFGEKLLAPDARPLYEKTCHTTSHVVHVDTLDRRLLFAMSAPGFTSTAKLSRELQLSFSTIDYRIKKLQERRIIYADLHDVHGELLRLERHLVLVSMRGFPQQLHHDFHLFTREHPYVSHYSHEIGNWDFILEVSLPSGLTTLGMINQLKARFGSYVANVQPLPVYKQHKMIDYPLDPGQLQQLQSVGNA